MILYFLFVVTHACMYYINCMGLFDSLDYNFESLIINKHYYYILVYKYDIKNGSISLLCNNIISLNKNAKEPPIDLIQYYNVIIDYYECTCKDPDNNPLYNCLCECSICSDAGNPKSISFKMHNKSYVICLVNRFSNNDIVRHVWNFL